MEETKTINDNIDLKSCHKKAKKSRKKVLVCIISLVLLFIIAGGGLFYSYIEFAAISKTLKNGELTTSIEKIEKINPITSFIFKRKIIASVEESVIKNKYAFYDDGNLIYLDGIKDYKSYKKIVDTLGLSPEKNNISKYIYKVNELLKYEKYNTISNCIDQTAGDISSALECLQRASSTNSSYLKSSYYTSAVSYMRNARDYVDRKKGFLVDEYNEGIDTLLTGLAQRMANSVTMLELDADRATQNIKSGQDKMLNVIEELENPSHEIDKIMEEIKAFE